MTPTDPGARSRYRGFLQGEIDGAAVYGALAESEKDPRLAEVFRRLAAVENRHAAFWRRRLELRASSAARPSPRARLLAWLGRRFGPDLVVPVVAASEARDRGIYDNDPAARTARMPEDERSHARLLRQLAGGAGLSGSTLAMIEGRHRGAGGNALRAAVLGANDGLVSNLCLIMGVAGASVGSRAILLTGLAGLTAGACSMAMGEWLSVTSSRELFQRQIAAEAAELEAAPDEEKEELVLIYQAKGLDETRARSLAERVLSQHDTALDTLAREELGIDPESLGGSPWSAAASSFVLFSIGAAAPIAPFLFLSGSSAVWSSLAVAGAALAGVGAGTSLFTGKNPVVSALRQLAFGIGAAAVTYGVGLVASVALH